MAEKEVKMDAIMLLEKYEEALDLTIVPIKYSVDDWFGD